MKKIRKAFTITELVIVIAVIAILAAVLIPTFTNVIRRAKISSDTQTVASLNTALSAYAVDHAVDSEEDLRAVFDGTYGEGFYDSLRPESAQYGYHYWYDTRSGRLELSRSGDLAEGEMASAQAFASLAFAEGGAPSFAGAGLRASLKEGYVLLDKGGSAVADTLSALDTLADAEDYLSAVQKAGKLGTEDASLQEPLHAALQSTAILTDAGAFRFAGESAVQLQIAPNVTKLSGALYIYDESAGEVTQTQAGEAQPVVYAAEGRFVLPESVSLVDSYALYFAGGNAVFLEVPAEADMMHLFSANGTNATIVRVGDSAAYTISGGTIYANGQPLEGSLAITHAVRSFEIGVMGGENLGGTYSVALDAISGPLAMYAYNFVAEDGGTLVSDSRVSWAIESQPGGAGAKIDEDGAITDIAAGETMIKATSVQNPDVSARFTIRIGAVINQSSVIFVGGNLTQIDGVTREVKIEKDYVGEFSYEVNTVTNYPDIAVDGSYTLISDSAYVEVVGNVVSVYPGAESFTLTLQYDKYNVSQSFNFIVKEIVSEFECIAPTWENIGTYLYKVGNTNAIDTGLLWQFTGLHTEYGLSDEEIGIVIEVVNAYDGQTLSNRGSQQAAQSAGGLQYYQSGSMIGFAGQGVVRVNITAQNEGSALNSITVPMEILDGYNVTSYAELQANSDSNKMILRDIELERYNYSNAYVVNGATLYGNGFLLDGTDAQRPSQMQWHVLISVYDAVVDNVRIVGQPFPEVDWSNSPYAGYTLSLYGSYCELYNSYLYGSRAPLFVQCGTAFVGNTVLEGGVLANAVLECSAVTLENVTTIQNVDSESIKENGITEENLGIGLGIFVNESVVDTITITLKGDFRQYNWISTGLVSEIKDPTYRSLADYLVNNADAFKHQIDGAVAVNAGIVFHGERTNPQSAIIDARDEEIKAQIPYHADTMLSATIYSISAGADISDRTDSNAFKRTLASLPSRPKLSLDVSGIAPEFEPQVSGNTLQLTLTEGAFTLTGGSLPIAGYFYGRPILSDLILLSASADGGETLPSLTVGIDDPRNVEFYVKISMSESYTADGELQSQPQTYVYTFILNTILDLEDAQLISSGGGENFYVSVSVVEGCGKGADYRTAAYILDGLVIKDYNEAGEYVEMDFSGYTSLPEQLKIKSFSGGQMSSADKYELKIYDGKLLIVSVGASNEKGSETMKVVLTWEGKNGKSLEITLNYSFTGSTRHISESSL